MTGRFLADSRRSLTILALVVLALQPPCTAVFRDDGGHWTEAPDERYYGSPAAFLGVVRSVGQCSRACEKYSDGDVHCLSFTFYPLSHPSHPLQCFANGSPPVTASSLPPPPHPSGDPRAVVYVRAELQRTVGPSAVILWPFPGGPGGAMEVVTEEEEAVFKFVWTGPDGGSVRAVIDGVVVVEDNQVSFGQGYSVVLSGRPGEGGGPGDGVHSLSVVCGGGAGGGVRVGGGGRAGAQGHGAG